MSSICKVRTVWSGNTFPIRDQIRALGGKWDAARKVWIVPPLSMRDRSGLWAACGGLKGVTIEEDK